MSDVIQEKIAMEMQRQNDSDKRLNSIDELVSLVDIFRDISISLETISKRN